MDNQLIFYHKDRSLTLYPDPHIEIGYRVLGLGF